MLKEVHQSGLLLPNMYLVLKFLAGTHCKSAGFGVKFVMAKFVIARVYCIRLRPYKTCPDFPENFRLK
jgi:hypothetical protein